MLNVVATRAGKIITLHPLVLVLVLGALSQPLVACSKTGSKEARRKRTPTVERAAAVRVLESFAAEFGATTNWLESSRQRDWGEPVFTFQARRDLIPSDGRPTVIIAKVIDVVGLDHNGYEIRTGAHKLDLILQADEKAVQTIMQNPHGMLDYFAAIVRVASLRKRLFSLNARSSEEEGGMPYATIEPSEDFVGSGVCLAIRPLGKQGWDLAFEYNQF